MDHKTLTKQQANQYERDGFVVMEGLYGSDECDDLVKHIMELYSGSEQLKGFDSRLMGELHRTLNQHFYNPIAMEWLEDKRLQLDRLEPFLERSIQNR